MALVAATAEAETPCVAAVGALRADAADTPEPLDAASPHAPLAAHDNAVAARGAMDDTADAVVTAQRGASSCTLCASAASAPLPLLNVMLGTVSATVEDAVVGGVGAVVKRKRSLRCAVMQRSSSSLMAVDSHHTRSWPCAQATTTTQGYTCSHRAHARSQR